MSAPSRVRKKWEPWAPKLLVNAIGQIWLVECWLWCHPCFGLTLFFVQCRTGVHHLFSIGHKKYIHIIIMYIYHALINALSAHVIHINLMIFYTHAEHSPTKTISIKYRNMIFYTHVEHSPTKTILIKYYKNMIYKYELWYIICFMCMFVTGKVYC